MLTLAVLVSVTYVALLGTYISTHVGGPSGRENHEISMIESQYTLQHCLPARFWAANTCSASQCYISFRRT